MIDIIIREFDERDAETVSRLIRNNLTFVNSRDYEPAVIDYMCRLFTPDYLCGISATRTMFVAEENGKVVGTVGLEGDESAPCTWTRMYMAGGLGNVCYNASRILP